MSRSSSDDRPKIWSEGRQHPPLNLRAFALSAVTFAREGLAGLLTRCAVSARDLGTQVQAGALRIPESRLGRAGRYLPSHQRIAQAVTGGAGLLDQTARVVQPVAESSVPPSIFTAAPLAPRPTQRLPRATLAVVQALHKDDPADADLEAIRVLMEPAAAPPPAEAPALSAAPAPVAARPGPLTLLRGAFARALGYGLLVMAVPYGAIKAGIAHLNGEDLRKLVDGESA